MALHGVGDTGRYDLRMKAIEFAMEHDDGASLRNLEQSGLILGAVTVREDLDLCSDHAEQPLA